MICCIKSFFIRITHCGTTERRTESATFNQQPNVSTVRSAYFLSHYRNASSWCGEILPDEHQSEVRHVLVLCVFGWKAAAPCLLSAAPSPPHRALGPTDVRMVVLDISLPTGFSPETSDLEKVTSLYWRINSRKGIFISLNVSEVIVYRRKRLHDDEWWSNYVFMYNTINYLSVSTSSEEQHCFLVSLQSKRASEETSSVCEEIRSDHYSPAGSMDTKHTSYSQNDPFVRLPDRKEADFPSDPFRLSRSWFVCLSSSSFQTQWTVTSTTSRLSITWVTEALWSSTCSR